MRQVLNNPKQAGGKKLIGDIARAWRHDVRKMARHLGKKQWGGTGVVNYIPALDVSVQQRIDDIEALSKKSSASSNMMMSSADQQAALELADKLLVRENASSNLTGIVVERLREIDALLTDILAQSANDSKTITGLTTKVSELEEKLAKAAADLEKAARDLATAQQQDVGAGMNVAEMKDTIKNLSAELAKAKEFEKIAKDMQGSITKEQAAELLKDLADKDAELSVVKSVIEGLKTELTSKSAETENNKKVIAELEKKLAEATAQRDTVIAERDALSATAANSGVARDGEVQKIKEDLTAAIAALAEAQKELISAKAEVEAARKELEDEKKKYLELEQKLAEEKGEHNKTSDSLKSMNAAFMKVMTKLGELDAKFVESDTATLRELAKGAHDRLESILKYTTMAKDVNADDFKNLIHAVRLESAWARNNVLEALAAKYSHDESVRSAFIKIKEAVDRVNVVLKAGGNEADLKTVVTEVCSENAYSNKFFCTVAKLAVIDKMIEYFAKDNGKYSYIIPIIADISV